MIAVAAVITAHEIKEAAFGLTQAVHRRGGFTEPKQAARETSGPFVRTAELA